MNGARDKPVLSVRNLTVHVREHGRERAVVNGLGFDLHPGEVLALVGESGCGKSKTAEAIMRLLPGEACRMTAEAVLLEGVDLAAADENQLEKIRGRDISMVFQEPLTALDPVFRCGHQLATQYRRHRGQSHRRARASAIDMLRRVGFGDPEHGYRSYPHELSGGMRQRVVIAMAMACRPKVLIADEATTALDVTTQAAVLERLLQQGREDGTAVLLITHDLGVVAQYCDRALVMRDGVKIEENSVEALFAEPVHEYSAGLVDAAREMAR